MYRGFMFDTSITLELYIFSKLEIMISQKRKRGIKQKL